MTIVAFSRKVCLCGGGRLYAGWERHGHEEGDEEVRTVISPLSAQYYNTIPSATTFLSLMHP